MAKWVSLFFPTTAINLSNDQADPSWEDLLINQEIVDSYVKNII